MRQKRQAEKINKEENRNGAGLRKDCATLRAGQDIVVSRWIGLSGTAQLTKRYYERLRKRFPARMIDEAAAFDRYRAMLSEAATAIKSGVCGIYDLSDSGVFAGLWEMAEEAGVGLEADLRKIPVRQETIEICEVLGENPYELLSGGSLLMISTDGNALVAALEREGIPAVVIGRTTAGNDRVLYNQGHKRYLNKPRENIKTVKEGRQSEMQDGDICCSKDKNSQ